MSVKLNFQGVEVTCDTPEEAMVLASSASAVKPPKATDLAKLVDRPIKIVINGTEMVCESPVSAAAMLVSAGVIKKPKSVSQEQRGAQGSGPQRAWQQAEEYGKKYNISTDEARRVIAKKKRELKARLALGNLTAEDKKFMDQLKSLPSAGEDLEANVKKKK